MKEGNQATAISAYTGHAREVFDELYSHFCDDDPTGRFILRGKKPIACPDFKEWAGWLISHDAERLVAKTAIGRAFVVTVFDGDSRGWPKQCPRLVFKTEVFEADRREPWVEQFPYRYSTWAAAERGHARAVQIAKRNLTLKPRRRKATAGSPWSQDNGGRQSPRRKLTELCQTHHLIMHDHRGLVFFRFSDFAAHSVKEAIAYAEGYGDGYRDAMHDETGWS